MSARACAAASSSASRLAESLGTTYQTVQKYERGIVGACISGLFSMATLLKVPTAWFFDGLPRIVTGRASIAIPEHELHSRETLSLAHAYFRIAPDRRQAILQLIRSMTETSSG